MKRLVFCFIGLMLVGMLAACSLPPERPVTKADLMKTNIYSTFTVKEPPESVLAALNRDGEVVVEASYKGKGEYYLKIVATSEGLKYSVIEK
ncbi:hypothetical protein [Geobacter argillaceus]|uniref:Lipoprotein n=1 Tax=Geobacter argillaceus TaxID=345631 RepID=A0A562VN36_9BACT|nr:hypothetical protein [Geobacter argillaceus]TWJ19396.1 hypothetical protein JN12_01812 [Geobacter argillaceus]